MAKKRANRSLRLILLALLVITLGLLVLVFLAKRPLPPHQVRSGQDTMRVLFIGNSYTWANNLPGLVIELAAHESKPLDAEMVVYDGATLQNHWDWGNALAAIQRENWDYVVLQEQSTFGSNVISNGISQLGDPATFHDYVRLFNSAIGQVGAKTVLYLTWTRQNAPQFQVPITKAYMDIAHELQAVVTPVGLAWQRAATSAPNIVLYQSDGSHPDTAGSYLAACVFYATFYGKSPEGLPAHISSSLVADSGLLEKGDVNLSSSDALLLQQIAWQTVSAQ